MEASIDSSVKTASCLFFLGKEIISQKNDTSPDTCLSKESDVCLYY